MANWYKAYLAVNPALKELPEHKRARHSIHFRRPDGLIEAHFTGAPCFYDDNGTWKELDTALQDDGTYWYAPGTKPRIRKSDKRVSIRDGIYTQTTSRIGLLEPSTGAFRSLWTIPAGTISGDSVVSSSPNAYEHRITVTEDGLRETLTILRKAGLGNTATEWLVLETVVTGKAFADGWVSEFSADEQQFPLPHAADANGVTPECQRYAKTIGGVQYLYTGVLANWFTNAAYPVVIDPDFAGSTSDGAVWGTSAVYATANATATSNYATDTYLHIGQNTDYRCYRAFLKFDTSALPDAATISQVNLKLVCTSDSSIQDFDVQIVKQNWSSEDPLTSSNRETAYDNCIAGTADDNNWRSTSGIATETAYTSGNLAIAWPSKTGNTYYSLRSSRDYASTTPITGEYIQIASAENATEAYRPVLIVDYSYDASGSAKGPGTMATSSATAPYDDEDWNTPNNAKANDGSYALCTYTAQTSATRYANDTLVTTNATAPYDDTDWDDKVGVGADDSATASITNANFDNNVITYLAKAQGFGFTIPTNSIITGIKVEIERTQTSGGCVDLRVCLLNDSGGVYGENKADIVNEWTKSTYVIKTYGGNGDMWGLSTGQLTPALINDADFGVGFAIKSIGANTDAFVDFIRMTVYYNEPTLDTNDYSYLLKASNFGFYIPSDATVTGIKVSIERKAGASNSIKDAVVKLLDATGALTGDSQADTSIFWPTSDTVKDYGGDGTLWGASPTAAMVMDTDFGVAIAIQASTDDALAYIDYITLTVYYTLVVAYVPRYGFVIYQNPGVA